MKVLIYGMQSSGASLFTYFMGQNKDSAVIIDLFNKNLAPDLDYPNVILKCVMTNRYTWEQHCDSFQPDKTILFLRNPINNYASLQTKSWKNEGGLVDDKMRILEQQFLESEKFDFVAHYEDMVMNQESFIDQLLKNDFNVDKSFFDFNRKTSEMAKFNHKVIPSYCGVDRRYHQRSRFGSGCIHDGPIDIKYAGKDVPTEVVRRVNELCPRLSIYYFDFNFYKKRINK